jgi:hypothetical protein
MMVVGNSFSLEGIDLAAIPYPTISCNRILRHESFTPTYLMMSDREAYIQERDAGRLMMYSAGGGNLMLTETIFDPKIKGKRADKDKSREYPAQPEPEFPYYSWRVGAWHTPPSLDTFDEFMCSCMNIAGPMIQAAVILGAKEIGVVGVDLMWPAKGKSHFFGNGKEVGAFRFVSMPNILSLFKKLKRELETRGIKVWNLSPEKNTPFGKVFPHQAYDEFTQV